MQGIDCCLMRRFSGLTLETDFDDDRVIVNALLSDIQDVQQLKVLGRYVMTKDLNRESILNYDL